MALSMRNLLYDDDAGDVTNGMFNGPNDFRADYINNRYWKGTSALTLPGLGFTSTHAGPLRPINASGTYDLFGANVTPRNNLGLLGVPTVENKVANSASLYDSGGNSATVTNLGNAIDIFNGTRIASTGATWNRLGVQQNGAVTGDIRTTRILFQFGSSGFFRADAQINHSLGINYPTLIIAQSAPLIVNTTDAGGLVTFSNLSNTLLANGLYELIFTTTYNALAITYSSNFAIGPNSAVTGEYVDAYFQQDEAGSFATPPIVTAGTAVTAPGPKT